MMTEKDEQQKRVRSILTEAVTLLCRSGLSYNSEFTVEGLLGITVDNADIFLVNIRETVSATMPPMSSVMSHASSTLGNVGCSSASGGSLSGANNLMGKEYAETPGDYVMSAAISPASSKHRDVLLSYDSCFTTSVTDRQPENNKHIAGGDEKRSDDDVALLTCGTDSSESDPGMNPLVTSAGTRRNRASNGAGAGGKRRRVFKVCRSINENSCDLSLSEGDMPVIVGMADLPGISDIPSMTGIISESDHLDMSDMTSSYFDDVVVEVSHDGALFTNVELDEIIGGKVDQSKFTGAELDDIMGKASQSKSEELSSSGDGFDKRQRLLLPVSDSDESDSPNFCGNQSYETLPNYCGQSDETSTTTNYCVEQSRDVLISGADSGGGGGNHLNSPSMWDPATDDSLGGGEMAPLNLAGPQDLSTGIGKQRHTCQLCGKKCRTESRLKKHKCRSDKDMPEPLNLIRQPLDLTVGRLDGSDPSAYMYADLLSSGADLLTSGAADLLTSGAADLLTSGAADLLAASDGFTCVCSRSFSDYDVYVQHAGVCNKAQLTPYKSCEICGKFFFSNSGYVKHKKQHVGEYKFRCGVCHKGFFDRTHLRAHVDSSHSKVRRYACLRCSKSFFWKHHLKRHLVVCTDSAGGGGDGGGGEPSAAAGGAADEEVMEEGEDEEGRGELLRVENVETSEATDNANEICEGAAPLVSEEVDVLHDYMLNGDDTIVDI